MHIEDITIVIPAFNEEGNIFELHKRLCSAGDSLSNSYRFQFLFINDGSTDNTLSRIKELAARDKRVRFISFSRNFGHQSALRAGFDFGAGEAVICMDADLQHPPEIIPEIIQKWKSGFLIVNTRRLDSNNQSLAKKVSSKFFYKLINRLVDFNIEYGIADFRLLDAIVVRELRKINEDHPFYRGIIPWMGFPQVTINYSPDKRYSGSTKYSFRKMMFLALSGITSFSVRPLRISIIIGIILAVVFVAYALYAAYIGIFTDQDVKGWTSVIMSILFIGSLQLIILGIIGEYLGKLFMENKHRPHYIIHEREL